MIFGQIEDQSHMQMLCEARDQRYNNDLLIATERKMWHMSIFPPIISQRRSTDHHAFWTCRWRPWAGWHDLGLSRIPQLDFQSATYPAVSLVGHAVSHFVKLVISFFGRFTELFEKLLKSYPRRLAVVKAAENYNTKF